jgi:gentisate 1,2-dioxygenase
VNGDLGKETDFMEAMANSELARLSRDLESLNAKPLWERTARMGPGSPAVPTIWRYRDMRPQLLRAVELITAKEAERRVFMLELGITPVTRQRAAKVRSANTTAAASKFLKTG